MCAILVRIVHSRKGTILMGMLMEKRLFQHRAGEGKRGMQGMRGLSLKRHHNNDAEEDILHGKRAIMRYIVGI